MGVQAEGIKVIGRGVATGWTPEDLARKEDLTNDLIHAGWEGMALEQESRRILAERYTIKPFHEADSYNTLVSVGIGLWMDFLIGAQGNTNTSGQTVAFTNTFAALGVGDATTANSGGPPPTQTNLLGAVVTTDRIRKGMNSTFPSRASNVVTFQSTFATTEANFTWNEWGIFNSVTDAQGYMLNRAVTNLGTKTSASAWQLTATLTLS